MHKHLMVDWVLRQVTIFPPEETQSITVIWCYTYLMEHLLHICHLRNWFLPKSEQHACDVVYEVRALRQLVIR